MKVFLETFKTNRKVQVLLLLLVAVLVNDAGFYFLRAAPAAERALAQEGRLRALREEIRAKDAECRLYLSYDKGFAEVEAFKDRLPRRSEYPQILNKVYMLAKEDRMKSASFGAQTREIKQEGDIVQLNFSMPISGSYRDVRKFIYDVESSPLFLNIDNLGLSKAGDADEISLTISLSTYMRS